MYLHLLLKFLQVPILMLFSQVRWGGVRRLHPVRPSLPHLRLHQEEEE